MSEIVKAKDKANLIVNQMQGQFAKVLPKILPPERFCRVLLTAMNKNPALAEALNDSRNQASVLSAFMRCAEMGLEPDGRRAVINCYKKGNTGTYDVTLIPMFQGLAELAMRSGLISNIHCDKVCENDDFSWENGEIKHKIDFRKPRGAAYAFYCIVKFKDGSIKTETMSLEEVNAIRDRSTAYQAAKKYGKSCPWMTDAEEMAKKGLACNTPIFTSEGWKTMEDIQVNDVVYDINGTPTFVMAISEIKNLPCYEIEFSNGEKIICDHEHRWVCGLGKNAARDIKTLYITEMYKEFSNGTPITVPVALPVDHLCNKSPNTDPYILGYWLGNGTKDRASVTCNAKDLKEICKAIDLSLYKLGKARKYERSEAFCVGIKNGFKDFLVSSGLYKNKHIPQDVFLWSVQDRIDFIRGLMDSDGCIEKTRGRAIFASKDKKIAEDMCSLLHSLGEFARVNEATGKGYGKVIKYYRVEWKPYIFIPVTLERKKENCKKRKIKNYRSIRSIRKVDSVPTKCIGVSSPTETYLAGYTFVPTHNTVFRRCSKWLPLSPEQRAAIEADDDDYSATAASFKQTTEDKFAQAMGMGDAPAESGETIDVAVAVEENTDTAPASDSLFEKQ